MQTAANFYSLKYNDVKTYIFASLFLVGNILLPQICHLFPHGGMTWLPIYFFTLIGAYKYGWRVGLLTAVASPLVNSALFGMPGTSVLPAIILKSTLLAVFAGVISAKFKKASLLLLFGAVMGYQLIGTLGEWAINGDFNLAVQDFRMGIPGMMLQIFGGWLVINKFFKR